MANLQRCGQGHFYDADRYTECPYCASTAQQPAPPRAGTAPSADPGATQPLNDQGVGATQPLRGEKFSPTQPIYQPEQTPPMAASPTGMGWQGVLLVVVAVFTAYQVFSNILGLYTGFLSFRQMNDGWFEGSFWDYLLLSGTFNLIGILLLLACPALLTYFCVRTLLTRGQRPSLIPVVIATVVLLLYDGISLVVFLASAWGYHPPAFYLNFLYAVLPLTAILLYKRSVQYR